MNEETKMMVPLGLRMVSRCGAVAALVLAVGCGADETQPTTPDHTPESYAISIDGSPVTAPYQFTVGQTVLVQLHFVNKEGESLDDVESSHFAGLTFEPATLATAVRRADHHFQFDVTPSTGAGSGTLTVGFGHDDAADEVTFPAAQVTVEDPGSGGL
jgi:hypothetical protein